jgi:hypothetical protein
MKSVQMAVAGLLASALLSPAVLAETIHPSTITAAETTKIDTMAQRTFDHIRNGKSAEALNLFFGTGSLMQGKAGELSYLASQIDSVSNIYGPMGECRLADERIKVGLVVQRLYLCRHGQYMTRWKLLFANPTSGWTGANLFFDDKVWLGLDD